MSGSHNKTLKIEVRVDEDFAALTDELARHRGLNRSELFRALVIQERERLGLNEQAATQFIRSLLDKFGAGAFMEIGVDEDGVLSVKIDGKPVTVDPLNHKNVDLPMYTVGTDDKVLLYLDGESSGVHLRVAEIPNTLSTWTLRMPMTDLSPSMQSLDAQADSPEQTIKR